MKDTRVELELYADPYLRLGDLEKGCKARIRIDGTMQEVEVLDKEVPGFDIAVLVDGKVRHVNPWEEVMNVKGPSTIHTDTGAVTIDFSVGGYDLN